MTGDAWQRQRLIDSFTRDAAEHGYAHVTVDRVAGLAGVSRATFYEHFESKHHCLIAAHDAFFDRFVEQVERACETEDAWPAKVEAAVGAGLEFLAETSSRARVFAVEAMSAGALSLERRFAHTARLAELLRHGRRHVPAAAELPDSTEWILMNGVASHVTAHLLAEEPIPLPQLKPDLVEVMLIPYLGNGSTRRAAAAGP
jgi:AcrR family transcriptional regulator